MKKFLIALTMLFAVVCFGLVGCGNPYANMKIEVSQNEIVLYTASDDQENQPQSVTITATVSGADDININKEVWAEYTERDVVTESIVFDSETGESEITLTAIQKGFTTLKIVSKDNDTIKSEEIKISVITPIQSFDIKPNTTLSIASGQALDLNTLDIFNFSPDTNQTEVKFSLLSESDPRFDTEKYNYTVQGVSIDEDGILRVEDSSLGGMIQILATSEYMPESPTEEQVQNLSKVFNVMSYRAFSEEQIKVYLLREPTTPTDNILLTLNTDLLNKETFMIGIENDVESNFNYSVTSNDTEAVKVIEGFEAGGQVFTVSPVSTGETSVKIKVSVLDLMVEPAKVYVEKEITFPINIIRTAKYIQLSNEDAGSVTNDNLNVDVYKSNEYVGSILGTQVDVSVTPTAIENNKFILRLKSVDGVDVEEGATRDDIIVKLQSPGNPDGVIKNLGEEIEPGSIFVSYTGNDIVDSFVLEVVANANDERLEEVTATISFKVQPAVGNISLPLDGYRNKIRVDESVPFVFVSSGDTSRFNFKVSNPNVISYEIVSKNRELKIKGLNSGEATLTITAKGTGAYLEVSFIVIKELQGLSLQLPNSVDAPKLVYTNYSSTPIIDGEGLKDDKPLLNATSQVGASFNLSVILNPDKATLNYINYESSNTQVATISADTGRIVTFNEGNTTIKVTFEYEICIDDGLGNIEWKTKQNYREFELYVYRPIKSFTWLNGTNELAVEIYDYNSLSVSDQILGKASMVLQASISPSTATFKDIVWKLIDENDADFIEFTPMGNELLITGKLPLDYEDDEKEVKIEGTIEEINGSSTPIVCYVKIKKPKQLDNIVIEGYNEADGVYLESAGAEGVSYSSFTINPQVTPLDAFNKEVSYVVFSAERINGKIEVGDIATEETKIVDVKVVDGVASIVPVTGKKGYAVVRAIPSSMLNMERPTNSEDLSDEENIWVKAVTEPSVYFDMWVLVADGSEDAQFQITTVEEFREIEVKGLDKHYQIRRDLDFSTIANWTPIGGETGFSGSLTSFVTETSKSFVLSGINIDTSTYSEAEWNKVRFVNESSYLTYLGIFTKFSGVIENVDITFDKINYDLSSAVSNNASIEQSYIGGIAGINLGEINNVNVTYVNQVRVGYNTTLTDVSIYVGGLVGANLSETITIEEQSTTTYGTITNSTVVSKFVVNEANASGTSQNNIYLGSITGANTGKINAFDLDASMTQSKTQVNVDIIVEGDKINNSAIGGLVGVSGSQTTKELNAEIKNFSVVGSINAINCDNVGGLVGANYGAWTQEGNNWSFSGSYLESCASYINIKAKNNVGGAVGVNDGGNIVGVKYEIYRNYNVENKYSNTAIQGADYVGGLIGKLANGSVQYSYVSSYNTLDVVENSGADIDTTTQYLGDIIASSYVGGLVGYAEHSTIKNSYARVSMNTNGTYIGGLVGYFDDTQTGTGIVGYVSEISNSYAITNILNNTVIQDDGSHFNTVAGFIGAIKTMYNQVLINCYSVTGLVDNDVKGVLCWQLDEGTLQINQNYNCNFVNLVDNDTITFSSCYYALPTGVSESKFANGKPLSSMQGYSVTTDDVTEYFNGDAGTYNSWAFASNKSNTAGVWADYSLRIGLNNGLPMLFYVVRDDPTYHNALMGNIEVTGLSFAHLGNVKDDEQDILPTFFKIDEGKIVAIYNNMENANKTYKLSDLIALTTIPEAAINSAMLYINSSDESVISPVSSKTTFENAELKFNKTGVSKITIMSAQNFNVFVEFQISVISGFDKFEMHKGSWVEGTEEDTIIIDGVENVIAEIKVNEAENLITIIQKADGNNFVDNLSIIYTMQGANLDTQSYAQFVENSWVLNGDHYYVEIPISESVKHLLEGVKSTVDLTDTNMLLTITAKLAITIPFMDSEGNLTENYQIIFDEGRNSNLFGEPIVLTKNWAIRVFEGVTGASFNTKDVEIENKEQLPVQLTVNTDATDEFILNYINKNYVKTELYINNTLITNTELSAGFDDLSAEDVTKLYNQIKLENLVLTAISEKQVLIEYIVELMERKLSKNYNLTYKFYIYNDLGQLINDNLELSVVLKPTSVTRLDTKHYLEATDIDNGKVASDEISSGRAGLLTVTVYPNYSDFDYITVSSSVASGDYISFVQYEKIGTDFIRVTDANYIDQTTLKAIKPVSFDGTFYFSTILGVGIPEGTEYAITVKAFKEGNETPVKTYTKYLTSRYVPYVTLSMESSFDNENIIPRGTAATINMTGVAQNSTVILSLSSTTSANDTDTITLKMRDNYNNGFKYYNGQRQDVNESFSIYVGPEAKNGAGGITLTAKVISDSITGGTEETVTTLTFYIVDYVVDSLGVQNVENNVWNPNMQETAELKMKFNIQGSTKATYEEYVGKLSDKPLNNFKEVPFAELGFIMGGYLDLPNGTTFVSGTALAANMGYKLRLSGLTQDVFNTYYTNQLHYNNRLNKPTASSPIETDAQKMVVDYKPLEGNNDQTVYGQMFKAGYFYGENEYKVTFIRVSKQFSITENEQVVTYNVNDCLFNVEVVANDEVLDKTIVNTEWTNIYNSVQSLLQEINTYGDGNGGVWSYLSGANYKPININVSEDGFTVSCDEGTRTYSIKAKTLDPITIQANIVLYYEFDEELNVYKLKFKTIDEISNTSGIGFKELSTSFTLQFESSKDAEKPIAIYNAEGLRTMVEGQHYMLASDIVLDNWTPLNTAIGSLDGNGYIIYLNKFNTSNLDSGTANIGLFGTLSKDTILKNLILDVSNNVYVEARNFKSVNFGFIAGVNNGGIITNCDVLTTKTYSDWDNNVYSKIQEETKETYAQTVFNQIRVEVENAKNANGNIPTLISTFVLTSSRVGGDDVVVYGGGIAGKNLGFITNSRVGRINGFMTATGYGTKLGRYTTSNTQGINIFCSGSVGGIAGYNGIYTSSSGGEEIGGVISSSYFANGYIVNTTRSGTGTQTGGLVGENAANSRITTSYVEGMQNSNSKESVGRTTTGGLYSYGSIGGLVHTNNGVVENSYSNIPITSSLGAGGFVYDNANENSVIKYSYSLSTVRSYNSNNGPFTGLDRTLEVLNSGVIENCYYLQDKGVVVSEDEKAIELTNDSIDGGSSQWSDPYGVYFVGFAFTQSSGDDDENANIEKSTTWAMPNSEVSARTGPQLVQTNIVTFNIRNENADYDKDIKDAKGAYGELYNPYLIATVDDYNKYLANNTNFTAYARLIADINFNEQSPRTTNVVVNGGNIQGNGMKLQNFKKTVGLSDDTTITDLGLFKSIENGVVSNVTVEINTQFSSMSATYVGGLAAQIKSSIIDNITIAPYDDSAMINGRNVVGGLAGAISGNSQIENITSKVSVFADYRTINTGGKYNYKYLKTTTNADGSINYIDDKNYSYAGGVAGILTKEAGGTDPTIVNCETEGDISVYADIVGGVFGVVDTHIIISRARFIVGDETSSQQLWGFNFAGGLVGENRGTIMQSFVSMETEEQIADDQELHKDNTATNHIGYTGLFNGSSNAIGGLVGLNRGNSSLDVSDETTQDIHRGVIKTSYSRVNVVNKDAQVAGGLIGLATYTYRISGDDGFETINVRKLSDVAITTYTGSDSLGESNRISFGSGKTMLSGYVNECYTTGAVYAGAKAVDTSSNLLFSQAASGGLVGAMTDPMGSIESSANIVLLNNHTQDLAGVWGVANSEYALGSVAGLVLYKTMVGEYGTDSTTQTSTVLFVKEKMDGYYPASEAGIIATKQITGLNQNYPVAGKRVVNNSLEKVDAITPQISATVKNSENITVADVAYSPISYKEAFGTEDSPSFSSNIWSFDHELKTHIFPIIAMGKVVSVTEIRTTEEFMTYMQGGVGGSYLLVNDITITGTDWDKGRSVGNERKALADGELPITGELKGYVGNGEPATITLENFTTEQLNRFNSLFGKVSGFKVSNINVRYPENITVTSEGAISDYFGLLACEATNYSNFENIKLEIYDSDGDNTVNNTISVTRKRGVGAFVGLANNCTFRYVSVGGVGVNFEHSQFEIFNDGTNIESAFGGVVGVIAGLTEILAGEYGTVEYNITTNQLPNRSNLYFGGIVGYNTGIVNISYTNLTTIINVQTQSCANIYTGGIIGFSSSVGSGVINTSLVHADINIENSATEDNVKPYIYAGGLAGLVYNISAEGNFVTNSTMSVLMNNTFTEAGTIYAGGVFGNLIMNVEYQNKNILANGKLTANDAHMDMWLGTEAEELRNMNVYAGGIVGQVVINVTGTAKNVSKTSIFLRNSAMGSLNCFGGYEINDQIYNTTAKVGGLFGAVNNYRGASEYSEYLLQLGESAASSTITVKHFYANKLGGLIGESRISVDNCGAYGMVSYTNTPDVNAKDYLYVGGLMGETSCTVSSCLSTVVIFANGVDQQSEASKINALVGYVNTGVLGSSIKNLSSALEYCVYNDELSGVTETISTSNKKDIVSIFDLTTYENFTGWTVGYSDDSSAVFPYPTNTFTMFESANLMQVRYISDIADIETYADDVENSFETLIFNSEDDVIVANSSVNFDLKNVLRVVGNGVTIQLDTNYMALALEVYETTGNFGLFNTIAENIIVSGITLQIPEALYLSVAENTNANIGLFAGVNNGTILNCQVGALPQVAENIGTVATFANEDFAGDSYVDVPTLNVEMLGGYTSTSEVYVGGLVGRNNGFINMCWDIVDINLTTPKIANETEAEQTTYKSYLGGLVGYQSVLGTTYNCYSLGRLYTNQANGPNPTILDKAIFGNYVGGVIGYDGSTYVHSLMGVTNIKTATVNENETRIGLTIGGYSGVGTIEATKAIIGCSNMNTYTLNHNPSTAKQYELKALKSNSLNSLGFSETIWARSADLNYGLPYLKMYSGNLSTGNGTAENPYHIIDSRMFLDMSGNTKNYASRHYVLTRDFVTVRTLDTASNNFYVFDGNAHSITLDISEETNFGTYGLFRKLDNINTATLKEDGVIKNLILKVMGIDKQEVKTKMVFGALVGENNGTVDNCAVLGVKNSDNYSVLLASGNESSTIGSMVGKNSGTIKNSFSLLNISGENKGYVGGLVGELGENGKILYSYYTGELKSANYVGGLVGLYNSNQESAISNCYVRGVYLNSLKVRDNLTYQGSAGAYIGYANSTVQIQNSYVSFAQSDAAGGSLTNPETLGNGVVGGYNENNINHVLNYVYTMKCQKYGGESAGLKYPTFVGTWQGIDETKNAFKDYENIISGLTGLDNYEIWGKNNRKMPYLRNVTPLYQQNIESLTDIDYYS
ncbi:MAG: Ig-like domain-containing protein [Clostridia bacterium]|nr:Ig-like domain-containing protein [Clostridia bacterium]